VVAGEVKKLAERRPASVDGDGSDEEFEEY
jgi:hypothetical protein